MTSINIADSDFVAISTLLSKFSWCIDRGDRSGLAVLFTEDGTLSLNGKVLRGRDQILAGGRQPVPGEIRKTRHLWTNLLVLRAEKNMVGAVAVQLTFEHNGDGLPMQMRVSDLRDEFERDADGVWRFTSRFIERQMEASQ